jgi:hypothetical protein
MASVGLPVPRAVVRDSMNERGEIFIDITGPIDSGLTPGYGPLAPGGEPRRGRKILVGIPVVGKTVSATAYLEKTQKAVLILARAAIPETNKTRFLARWLHIAIERSMFAATVYLIGAGGPHAVRYNKNGGYNALDVCAANMDSPQGECIATLLLQEGGRGMIHQVMSSTERRATCHSNRYVSLAIIAWLRTQLPPRPTTPDDPADDTAQP